MNAWTKKYVYKKSFYSTVVVKKKKEKKQLFLNTNIRAQNDPAHWLDASPTTTFSEEKKNNFRLAFLLGTRRRQENKKENYQVD